MSFSLTTPQMLARTKTVTRRNGWARLRPGTLLQAVEKSQGHADSSRLMPTDADHRQSEGVVESRGVETLTDSTPGPVATDPSNPASEASQRPLQQGSLPDVSGVTLLSGAHRTRDEGMCVMEAAGAERIGLLTLEHDREER